MMFKLTLIFDNYEELCEYINEMEKFKKYKKKRNKKKQ